MNANRDSIGQMPMEDLTWREQEVLALLAERLTNREIAERLHLAESTVKDYVSIILSKLYVKNRRQAVARAQELGLLVSQSAEQSGPRSNLPAEITQFIGREKEMVEVTSLIREARLVTLTGPGGIGKTRVALKVAQDTLGEFEQGTFFISLTPLSSVADIIQTTAEALNFPLASHGDPIDQLLRYLRSRQLLLVMDNFEHLLDGTEIVARIVQAAPGVSVLVTSRERLNLQVETVYPVSGLELPSQVDGEPEADAVTLFLSHARRINPDFAATPRELGLIAQICQLTDGMPLAIELAASWMHVLTVEEILAELQDNIDLLATDMRDIPERHRSIRAVFEQSWSLLGPEERDVFKRLAVFRGGFTREAAQTVAGATIQYLGALVDKSVVRYRMRHRRFEIHELLRQYAQEQLESSADHTLKAHQRHAEYYAEFMDDRWIHLRDERQVRALNEVEDDIENIRAAWRHYLRARDATQMRRFLYSFWLVYWVKGWHVAAVELFREVVEVFQEAQLTREEEIVRAASLANQAFFMCWLGLADEAFPMAKESVQILEGHQDFDALVAAYDSLTLAAYYVDNISVEMEGTYKFLNLARREEDPWALAFAYSIGAATSMRADDYDKAQEFGGAGVKLSEETGEQFSTIVSILTLGHLARLRGDLTAAEDYYQQSLQAAEQLGFYWALENAVKYLGQVTLLGGRFDEAEAHFLRSLKIANDLGLTRDIANHLYEFSRLRVAQDRQAEAVVLLLLLLRQPASDQARLGGGSIRENAESLLKELEQDLPADVYASARERGETLNLDETLVGLLAFKPDN